MSIIRPNGKPYVARKPIVAEEFGTSYGSTGVFVLRTHDEALARESFGSLLASLELTDVEPITTWIRLVPWDAGWGYDTSWVTDEVRGVPALEWNPS